MNKALEPSRKIEDLEKEIERLQGLLRQEYRKKDSLWSDLHSRFLQEGNTDENSAWWADEISSIFSNWVSRQRAKITERISSTGELSMPPYTDCLNDLAISLSPPGSEPPALPQFDYQDPQDPRPSQQEAPVEALTDMESLKPKKRRIGVPKPIPGAVPLPLPPLTKEERQRELAGK